MSHQLIETLKRFNYRTVRGSLIALIILFVISSFLSPYFLQFQNILNILRQVSYTGIIALGMCFVIIGGGHRPVRGLGGALCGRGDHSPAQLHPADHSSNDVLVIFVAIFAGLVIGTLAGMP